MKPLAIGLGAVVLVLVGFGLSSATRQSNGGGAAEIPARPETTSSASPMDPGPTTPPPSRAGTATTLPPSAVPTSLAQPAPTAGPPTDPANVMRLDTLKARVKLVDLEGRFGITVPQSWATQPAVVGDGLRFRLVDQRVDGTLTGSEFELVVGWLDSGGCVLARCGDEIAAQLRALHPTMEITLTPDNVGGRPAVRIESSLASERLVEWVVVQDDRVWIMNFGGPFTGFDERLTVVRTVLTTMSFG